MCSIHVTTWAQPYQVPFFSPSSLHNFLPIRATNTDEAPPQTTLWERVAAVLEETNKNLWGILKAMFLTPMPHEVLNFPPHC